MGRIFAIVIAVMLSSCKPQVPITELKQFSGYEFGQIGFYNCNIGRYKIEKYTNNGKIIFYQYFEPNAFYSDDGKSYLIEFPERSAIKYKELLHSIRRRINIKNKTIAFAYVACGGKFHFDGIIFLNDRDLSQFLSGAM